MKWFGLALLATLTVGLFIGVSQRTPQSSPKSGVAVADRGEEREEAFGYRAWIKKKYGIAPPNSTSQALAHIRRMQPMSSSRYDLPKWLERGPTNIPGRTKCIAIDPTDPKKYILATAGGGLWRSADGGATWTNTDGLPRITFTWVEFDQNDPKRVWASTGEAWGGVSGQPGDGLYFSSDRGATWKKLQTSPDYPFFDRILVGYGHPGYLWASGVGGIYVSDDNGATWTQRESRPVMMLRRFTGGASFTDYLYATVYDKVKGWGATYSNDGGITWQDFTGGWGGIGDDTPDCATIQVSGNGQTIFFATSYGDQMNTNMRLFTANPYTYTFSEVPITSPGRPGLCAYSYDLAVDPLNDDHLFMTAVNIWESTDGGNTWAIVDAPGVHVDAHQFILKSYPQGATKNLLYVTTDGGAYQGYRYQDLDEYKWDWNHISNGVASAQFWSVDGFSNGFATGGTQDNGTISIGNQTLKGTIWLGGDGSTVSIDHNDPNYIYGSTQYCGVSRSRDGGKTSEYIADSLPFAWNKDLSPFVPMLKLDPNDSTKLYVGGFRLYRTVNAKVTDPASMQWQTVFSSALGGQTSPTAFAFGKSNAGLPSKVMYVATGDGRVYRTADRTKTYPTWTTLEDNLTLDKMPDAYATSIFVDPTNHQRLYITFGYYSSSTVYRSIDGGATWKDMGGSGFYALPAVPANTVVENPSKTLLHVGTTFGIFTTSLTGTDPQWHPSSDKLVGTSVEELRYAPDDPELLFAATHGRGIWISKPIEIASLEAPKDVAEDSEFPVTVKLNRVMEHWQTINLSYQSGISGPASVQIPAGQSSVTFTAKSKALTNKAQFTYIITAFYKLQPTGQDITVHARPEMISITGKTACIGGDTVNLTVAFDSPIKYQPLKLTPVVSSTNLADAWPFTVPVGATSATFPVYTKSVSQVSKLTLWLKHRGVNNFYYLKIVPPIVSSFTLSKSSVEGGSPTGVTGTVKLDRPAGPGNVRVYFSSTDRFRAKTTVSDVVIPSGSDTATVNLTHFHGIAAKTVNLYAKTGEKSTKATLEVKPCQLFGIYLSSPSVIGGTALSGTLRLRYPNGIYPIDIPIASDSEAGTVLATVRIPANVDSALFPINTTPVSNNTPVNITATTGAGSASAGFLVYSSGLASISVNPTSVIGGSTTIVTGVINLNGVASRGGLVVSLSSDRGYVGVPATVTVPAGAKKAYFNITHTPVRGSDTATITATLGSTHKTATLLVK